MNRLFSPDIIDDGLWLGSAPLAPEDFRVLKSLGVTDIVSLRTEQEDAQRGINPSIMFRFLQTMNMVQHRVPVVDFDTASLKSGITRAVDVIDGLLNSGRKVYVHCALGMNRSPSVVAAWLGRHRNLDAQAAVELVKQLHPVSVPEVEAVRVVTGR